KTLTERLQDDVTRIDQELRHNLRKWNLEVNHQLSTLNASQKLLNDFSERYSHLRQELDDEKKRHQKTQQKLTRWTITFFLTVLLSNALIITLILFFR
ncbi:hypothetical protein, partial [Moellerella wisconsensis]